jgi:hypothetical protein
LHRPYCEYVRIRTQVCAREHPSVKTAVIRDTYATIFGRPVALSDAEGI